MADAGHSGVTATPPDRWEPDAQLVASYLAGARPDLRLTVADRCWVVAGLTLAGKTAEDIAERLGCSLRLVRTIRAEPMTQVCLFYQRESAVFSDELRLARNEQRGVAVELASTVLELRRAREQVNRLIGLHSRADGTPVFPRCGHVQDKYNTYTHGRKKFCRTCHRNRQRDRRRVHDTEPVTSC